MLKRANSRFSSLLSTPSWGGRSTRAEVNLDAIAENVRALRGHARAKDLMIVVKSDGYGHGAVEVSETVLENGATWLGVYTVSEGTRLRRAGIRAPILVFGAFEDAEAVQIVEWDLIPTIGTRRLAAAIAAANPRHRVPFHIKIDTGLSRSGIHPNEALPLLLSLQEYSCLHPQGIFTHFARADEPGHPETLRQFGVFMATCDALADEGFTFEMKHVANSGATLELPATHLSMVRCGIATYGYMPSPGLAQTVTLSPALSLVTTIVRLHNLPTGAGVGYGHEFVCRRPTLLALAPIGYGDGLPRSLGHGSGHVLIRGTHAPIVGRVSMDQITIDVTDVSDVTMGDTVTLIGADEMVEHSADDLAREAGTISYDILTGIMPRVPRLYVKQGMLRTSET